MRGAHRYNSGLRPFQPLFANPHLATIASNFWPRFRELEGIPFTEHRIQTERDAAIRVIEQSPGGKPAGDLVLVHGLEGSSDGGYMRSMAWNALQAGFRVHRVNIRGCGGTEGWCSTLYHAGLTSDLHYYLQQLNRPVTLVGYSLGGNVVLKLAAELGQSRNLESVVAVSTPIDLAECVRAIGRPVNYLYQKRFVDRMKERLIERRRCQPAAFDPIFRGTDVSAIRTIFDFDDRITAPHFGFGNAPNYYATQSSLNFLPSIAVPTLLLTAQDDPMVPFSVYSAPAIEQNSNITLIAPRHGGHVAFLSREKPRFWADETILGWLANTRNKSKSVSVSA